MYLMPTVPSLVKAMTVYTTRFEQFKAGDISRGQLDASQVIALAKGLSNADLYTVHTQTAKA